MRTPGSRGSRRPRAARAVALAGVGQAAGDVHQAEHGQHERAEADADAAAGLGVLRVAQEPHARGRAAPAARPGRPGRRCRRPPRARPGRPAPQAPPLHRGHDGGQAEQREPDAVPAVGRVEVARAAADPAGQRSRPGGRCRATGRAAIADRPRRAGAPARLAGAASAAAGLRAARLAGGRLAGRRLRRPRGCSSRAGARGRTGGHAGRLPAVPPAPLVTRLPAPACRAPSPSSGAF